MKTIHEPIIHLVGRPSLDAEALLEFLESHDVEHWTTDATSAGTKIPEVAGRLCYMSFAKPRPGGNSAYLDHIKEVGHGSVLEHSCWNFIIEGVSRSLTHELVRHRVGTAFSQESQRYVDAADVAFVVPPELELEVECARARHAISVDWDDESHIPISEDEATKLYPRAMSCPVDPFHKNADAGDRWLKSMERSRDDYEALTAHLAAKIEGEEDVPATEKRKRARQAARSVLPNACETRLFLSANARALRHFFSLRCSRHADAEIRRFAIKLLRDMQKEAPALFDDFVITTLPDGSEEATTSYPKV